MDFYESQERLISQSHDTQIHDEMQREEAYSNVSKVVVQRYRDSNAAECERLATQSLLQGSLPYVVRVYLYYYQNHKVVGDGSSVGDGLAQQGKQT